MPGSDTALFGIYAEADAAGAAVDQLLSAGLSASVISILLLDPKTIEGSPSTAAGEITDPGFGLLEGLGEFAIPAVGPLMAAGPIVTTLLGVAGGGSKGGLVEALIGLGVPEYEAKLYEGAIKDGGTLLSVRCDGIDRRAAPRPSLMKPGRKGLLRQPSRSEARLQVMVAAVFLRTERRNGIP